MYSCISNHENQIEENFYHHVLSFSPQSISLASVIAYRTWTMFVTAKYLETELAVPPEMEF